MPGGLLTGRTPCLYPRSALVVTVASGALKTPKGRDRIRGPNPKHLDNERRTYSNSKQPHEKFLSTQMDFSSFISINMYKTSIYRSIFRGCIHQMLYFSGFVAWFI